MFILRALVAKLLLQIHQWRGGRGVQRCSAVPFNAKCVYPRKLSLTESSEDISELTSFFEHITANIVTAYSIRAVWQHLRIAYCSESSRRPNNTFETQTKSPFFKQNLDYFHSPHIYLTFSFETLRSHEGGLLLLLLLFLLYNTEFIFLSS